MLTQINVVNDRIIKEIKFYENIETEKDLRVLENELKNHETFSEIVIDITDAGSESQVMKKWRSDLKKTNEPLHQKLVLLDGKNKDRKKDSTPA